MTKIYECAICKKLALKGIKGHERFRGIRTEVRKHLREVHNIKGLNNFLGLNKEEIGQSKITENTISEEVG